MGPLSPNPNSLGVATENISALERLEARGVGPTVEDCGADDVDRRIRTWIRPLPSISESVQSGSRPSREMTSLSTWISVMAAAFGPGNWARIRMHNDLYHEALSEVPIHGLEQRYPHNERVGKRRDGEDGDEPVEAVGPTAD
ncbi:isochorismatase domain-containing protein 2 [Striga asiatica]|uniref:Isochorismatase domain-containing protein 2 n=1 Tax=Striga asiatica TaxID=4170 RepID=A0A5A7Q0U0_STRAF|nr:isochorismatase domain-containing protein 2 [Striga asiatica]